MRRIIATGLMLVVGALSGANWLIGWLWIAAAIAGPFTEEDTLGAVVALSVAWLSPSSLS